MFHNDIWGTICDDWLRNEDVSVLCRQLGLPHKYAKGARWKYFGEGSGQIWLSNVNCSGSESSLDDCLHSDWGIHDCTHEDDIGIFCKQGVYTIAAANQPYE